jgi:hypothetical protein
MAGLGILGDLPIGPFRNRRSLTIWPLSDGFLGLLQVPTCGRKLFAKIAES